MTYFLSLLVFALGGCGDNEKTTTEQKQPAIVKNTNAPTQNMQAQDVPSKTPKKAPAAQKFDPLKGKSKVV